MNLVGSKFIDKNNKILTVYSQEDGIVSILETGSKVDVRVLSNTKYYTPYNVIKTNENINMSRNNNDVLNPDEFFKQTNFGNAFAPLFGGTNNNVARNTQAEYTENDDYEEGMLIQYDPQEEKNRIAEKYNIGGYNNPTNNRNPNIRNNNIYMPPNMEQEGGDLFVKVCDDVSVVPDRIPIPAELQRYNQQQQLNQQQQFNNSEMQLSNAPHLLQAMGIQPVVDPVVEMFKKVKKSIDFKFSFDIERKIPKLSFIEMMEESYEVSIIEYLAEDFVKTLLEDPTILKNRIADEIRRLIDNNVDVDAKYEKSIDKIETKIEEHV